MDLLSGDSAQISNQNARPFHALKLVDVKDDDVLPDAPYGAEYGRLSNGLTYYVRCNSKPKMRAALALAVKVGSVLEEEEERGVAHIVEHLAFRATKKDTNYDIFKFLESIGACHNAETSPDETVYLLLVPLDKPGLLDQSISVLAESSSGIRVSAEDLEKERGVVLEEYRERRTSNGRMQESDWVLRMKGSKYAERWTIGTEKVIRTVTLDAVKRFYNKWYHMQNMALIAVGDFTDTQSVVELIKSHFRDKTSALDPPLIPRFTVPSHEEPRYSRFVDSEAAGSTVMIGCKVPVAELKTVKDYRNRLCESMFFLALNNRFFTLSRKNNPPYFSCSAALDPLAHLVKAYVIMSSCKQNGTTEALESMLTEVARIRMHGFSEREISIARALIMIKSTYLERDQMESDELRDLYIKHFLLNYPVIGIEYQAQLITTVLPGISASEVSKYSECFRTSFSCVIEITEPRSAAKMDDLRNIVLSVNSLEEQGSIPPWEDEKIPEKIVSVKPNPGHVVKQLKYSCIGATEMIMSNGMRVCYKCTDFSDDEVIFRGFSYGGFSELQEYEYLSLSMGSNIPSRIGMFGHRPSVLADMLAGKRACVATRIGEYIRSFYGYCSSSDLETALQLVYQLFVTNLEPVEEDVKIVMQRQEEFILAKERDPYTIFADRVREINYGNSYFTRPIKIGDIRKVDPSRACEYYNNCFKDPSTFTVVLVGNIDPATACPLILQYLGGIPRPPNPIMNFRYDERKGLPYTFPPNIIREIVWSSMVEDRCSVEICLPIELKNEKTMMEDFQMIGIMRDFLETKILEALRFKHGQIYSVKVSVSFDRNKPSRVGDILGDITVTFSCNPKINSSTLVNLALDEIMRLQEEGPSDDDVSTILEIEKRAHEIALQRNNYWLNRILNSYQSRIYSGDLGASFQLQDEVRTKLRSIMIPSIAQSALQRIIPFPCKEHYTAVTLMPRSSHFKKLKLFINSRYAKILVGIALLAALALGLRRNSLWPSKDFGS